MFKNEEEGDGEISSFAALCTALSATIGTGNIVGVATAIGIGGPGAVFWMWFTGLLGMATKFGEATLAVKYRVKAKDGSFIGGPMYALERGMGQKWLGVLFAILTGIACFGIGNMTQATLSQIRKRYIWCSKGYHRYYFNDCYRSGNSGRR